MGAIARLISQLPPVAKAVKAKKAQRLASPYFLKAAAADWQVDPATGRQKASIPQILGAATNPSLYTKKYGMPSLLETPPPQPALGNMSNIAPMQPGVIYPAWYANAPANIPATASTSYYTLDGLSPSDKLKKFLEDYWKRKQ